MISVWWLLLPIFTIGPACYALACVMFAAEARRCQRTPDHSARYIADLETRLGDSDFEAHANLALLVASEAERTREQRRTMAKQAHPAQGRNAKAWAALVGETTTITEHRRWQS